MAHLVLSPLFCDHAVFPKGLPFTVFGECDTAGRATLTLADGSVYTADFSPENGRFWARFAAIDVFSDGATLTVTAGDASFSATDIAIGIVLLAAGQSNMEWPLEESVRPFPITPDARLRFYTEKHNMDNEGRTAEYAGGNVWFLADGRREYKFSAIGYFTAALLSRELSVTVGVIACNKGGSRIEAWISPEALRESGIDPKPLKPYPDSYSPFNRDHWLYLNKYVNVAAYAVSAVLWYQGESNVGFEEGEYYGAYLHTLIADWRKHNRNPRLPFYLVELAAFDDVAAGWGPAPLGAWAPVRSAIVCAPKTEQDVYAVSMTDTGESPAVIHPVNKLPVAEKLVRAILHTAFGYDLVYTGPVFDTATRDGDRLAVTFMHGEGLHFSDRNGNGEDARDAFFLKADGTRTAAAVAIDGDRLVATIPDGSIRFSLGYGNTPRHNLYNSAGYLASPFSVDLSVK